jgi:hypothetical protein
MKAIVSTLAIVILFLLPLMSVNGQEKTVEKISTGYGFKEEIVQKAKDINILNINNKYGNITIDGWDNDSVQIVYEISIGTYTEDLAQEILDEITVREYTTGKELFVKTVFEEEFHSAFTFSINYKIKVPYKLQTVIKTGFGNTFLKDIQGKISINAEYGKLFIKNTNSTELPELNLALDFVEGEIENAENASLNLNNCTFDIGRISNISGKTKFSVIRIDEVNRMNLISEIDRFTIGLTDSIAITGEKSFITINSLSESGHFEINTGGLKVTAGNTLKSLTVANIKANSEIVLPAGLNYLIHGEVKQGMFSHYRQDNLRMLREQETISFSGEFGDEPTANIIIFNTSSNLTVLRD